MFQLQPSPTFRTRVPLSRPGFEKPIEVPVEFRHKTTAQFAAWKDGMRGRADADVLHEVIVAWDGVVDDKGEPVPYSHTALVTLLSNYGSAAVEIFEKYAAELGKAKEKN